MILDMLGRTIWRGRWIFWISGGGKCDVRINLWDMILDYFLVAPRGGRDEVDFRISGGGNCNVRIDLWDMILDYSLVDPRGVAIERRQTFKANVIFMIFFDIL